MNKEQNKKKDAFQKEYGMFKSHHDPGYELKNIFEVYLPFWFCQQNVVVEKGVQLDRFSKIILETIQAGLTKHSEVCGFLGIKTNSFVSSQFHYLIKNGLLDEAPVSNDTVHKITIDGKAFLERRKKITSIETIRFEYYYNDLTLELMHPEGLASLREKRENTNQRSAPRNREFSSYQISQTHQLPENLTKIPHKNRPYNLNPVEFASFFNQHYNDYSFYDLDDSERKMHKRSICFLAFEYEDISGTKIYDIRHSKKTVKGFRKHEIEEALSKKVTEYFKKGSSS